MRRTGFWLAVICAITFFPVVSQATPVSEAGVKIFLYHHVKPGRHALNVRPEILARQLDYLRDNGYVTVTVDDVAAALRGRLTLPKRAVALTFDDTLDSHYRNAFPLLKARGQTATFYVSSDVIGGHSAMTWEQLREMRDAGMSFGSHGIWHARLTEISEARLVRELRQSKRVLEAGLGQPIRTFAYPFGRNDARVRAATAATGYVAARGVSDGPRQGLRHIYDLRCFDPTDSFSGFVRMLEMRR